MIKPNGSPTHDALARSFLAELPPVVHGLTSIIVLMRNGWPLTQKCLASIERCTPEPYELILVDNGSTDETPERLAEYEADHEDVVVIASLTNRGFAGGNNRGLARSRGELILFLNNDTIVTPGWLGRMRGVLDRHPSVGLVGPMSNWVGGPQLVADPPYRGEAELEAFAARWAKDHAAVSIPCWRLVGFCLLARRAVVERIGGFDERFSLGAFEDDDLCVRAAFAGFGARIAQDAFVHHAGNQTYQGDGVDYRQRLQQSWEVFKAKWGLPADAPLERGYRLPESIAPSGPASDSGSPNRYTDPVPNSNANLAFQLDRDCSSESTVPQWADGQTRFVRERLASLSRQTRILDVACGDGVELSCLRDLGFSNVVGVELDPAKAQRARASGFEVIESDFHDLTRLADESFDVVYSSHSLEHAYSPTGAVAELRRVLRPSGQLFVVLPYPDAGQDNDLAHGGKYELGTHLSDEGRTVSEFFRRNGFELRDLHFDAVREPEIWLTLVRSP